MLLSVHFRSSANPVLLLITSTFIFVTEESLECYLRLLKGVLPFL